MVLVKSPLLSESASGTIADNLTFSLRDTGQQVRFQKKQKDIFTVPREIQRTLYRQAYEEWNLLAPEDKIMWSKMASSKKMTGYNLYLKTFLLTQNALSYYGQSVFGVTIYGNS